MKRPLLLLSVALLALGLLLAGLAVTPSPAQANHNPDPPTNLRVTARTTTTITFAWASPLDKTDVNFYRIRWKTPSQTLWQSAFRNASPSTTREITGLSQGTAYEIDVASCEGQTSSHCGSPIQITSGTPLPAPSSFLTWPAGDGAVRLRYGYPNEQEIVGWRYEYKKTADAWTDASKVTGVDISDREMTNVTVSGLDAGASYDFRVHDDDLQPGTAYNFLISASNAQRQSDWTPGDGSVAATTADISATVTGTDPSPLTEAGLDGARLTVDLVATQYVENLTLGHFGLNPAPINTLISAIERVSNTRAVLTLGFTGDFSSNTNTAVTVAAHGHTDTVLLTTPTVQITAAPPPPQVLSVTADGGVGQVEVTWARAPGADGYKVQWKGPGESYDPADRQLEFDGGARTAMTPGLTHGTTYTVRVIATKRLAPDGVPSLELMATTDDVAASIASTNPLTLTERTLHEARLTVDLVGTQYASSLSPGQFSLTPSTSGLSIASVQRVSNTQAVLTLAITGNIGSDLNLSVVVDSAANAVGATLTTGAVTVTQAPRPGGVGGISLTPGPGSLDVSWNAASRLPGYVVQWKQSSASNYDNEREVSGRSTTRTTLGETGYDVRVYATSRFAANGPVSLSASHTTLPAHAIVSATDPLPLTENNLKWRDGHGGPAHRAPSLPELLAALDGQRVRRLVHGGDGGARGIHRRGDASVGYAG